MAAILHVENNYRDHRINQNILLPKLLYSIASHPWLCPQIVFPKQSCVLGYINLLCWEKRKKGKKRKGREQKKNSKWRKKEKGKQSRGEKERKKKWKRGRAEKTIRNDTVESKENTKARVKIPPAQHVFIAIVCHLQRKHQQKERNQNRNQNQCGHRFRCLKKCLLFFFVYLFYGFFRVCVCVCV